jgi:hypothetical protein
VLHLVGVQDFVVLYLEASGADYVADLDGSAAGPFDEVGFGTGLAAALELFEGVLPVFLELVLQDLFEVLLSYYTSRHVLKH